MARKPGIGEFRYPVWVCTTAVERPDPDTPSTFVDKPGVFRCYARIRNTSPMRILGYQAVFGSEKTPSVEVTIRNPPDVMVALNHWVYRIGPPAIWYRVRSVDDLGIPGFLVLQCSIDVINDPRLDPTTQQPPPKWNTPEQPLTPILDRI